MSSQRQVSSLFWKRGSELEDTLGRTGWGLYLDVGSPEERAEDEMKERRMNEGAADSLSPYQLLRS